MYCRSKDPTEGNGFDDAPYVEAKTTSDEGGDMYMTSLSTHPFLQLRLACIAIAILTDVTFFFPCNTLRSPLSSTHSIALS